MSGNDPQGPAPWYLGGGVPAPPDAPERSGPPAPPPAPVPPAQPIAPVPMVGPQAWLAEAAQTMPSASAPAGPPPWQNRQHVPTPQQLLPPQPATRQPATRQQPTVVGGPWASQEEQPPRVTARRRRRPVALFVAAVVAVAAVIAGGLVVSSQLSPASDEQSVGEGSAGGAGGPGGGSAAPGGDPAPLRPVSVTATCQAPPGQDAVGTTITYEPQLTLDAVGATAWRCPGAAVGQQLVYDFGAPVTVTSVALVPGYAKVDPADGTDRFLENRTVTAVDWQFDDGRTQRQSIASPSAGMAEFQLPEAVTTRRLVLEIAGTGNDSAVRNFTAISDVRFAGY